MILFVNSDSYSVSRDWRKTDEKNSVMFFARFSLREVKQQG